MKHTLADTHTKAPFLVLLNQAEYPLQGRPGLNVRAEVHGRVILSHTYSRFTSVMVCEALIKSLSSGFVLLINPG